MILNRYTSGGFKPGAAIAIAKGFIHSGEPLFRCNLFLRINGDFICSLYARVCDADRCFMPI